ncbi:MAG TPA: ABC transporter substrate-binding protein [Stellaceae bacterium]
MTRIAAVLALSLCAAVPALAQDRTTLPLVAMLRVNTPDTVEPGATMFRTALAALGHVDGRDIRLESRLAEGHAERLPELAKSLAAEGPAIIVTAGDPATRAAQQATSSIPIVALADDLVDAKFIASLAKPGGNVTGVSILATELDAKKLEMLKLILPGARRFGVLGEAASGSPARLQAIREAAQTLGVELQIVEVHSPADFAAAFASFRAGGTDAIDILSSPLLFGSREQLARLSLENKLPAICQFREMVDAGCIASYGSSLPDAYIMLAALTDKVLKGAQPANTPAQQPTRFELVINQKAARALGIEIPPPILVRADEIIE